MYAIRDVVLPILEDFKPDIIINSAGQDNHFSDPITNMNFCAQGYAALTELLSPDIAVLEGGYSIEGALPYVNLGIILAMAGIDYSKIREPRLRPGTSQAETGDQPLDPKNRRADSFELASAGQDQIAGSGHPAICGTLPEHLLRHGQYHGKTG